METFYHCAAFCGWQGTQPSEVFGMHDEHLRDECPRCGSDVAEGLTCETCHQAIAHPGFDDCVACAVAVILHDNDHDFVALYRKAHAGTRDLALFEAELARQSSAMVAA